MQIWSTWRYWRYCVILVFRRGFVYYWRKYRSWRRYAFSAMNFTIFKYSTYILILRNNATIWNESILRQSIWPPYANYFSHLSIMYVPIIYVTRAKFSTFVISFSIRKKKREKLLETYLFYCYKWYEHLIITV